MKLVYQFDNLEAAEFMLRRLQDHEIDPVMRNFGIYILAFQQQKFKELRHKRPDLFGPC